MVAALSTHSFSFFPIQPASRSTTKCTKILTLSTSLHHAEDGRLFPAFRILRSNFNFRSSFRIALQAVASDQKSINDSEDNQDMENISKSITRQNDNMKFLTQAFKEAFLNGNEKSVHEIEASICIVEEEKNELSIKSTDLISEIASLRYKFLRLNADFENMRKRSEKERHTFTSDNQAEVLERLLPIIDNFERVKQQVKPKTEREKKIDTSYQGIYKQFVEIMRCMRVSVVDTVGRPFDPSIHEAVEREESQQFKPGIITQEVLRGFVIAGRVLRPASVKVSVGPGPEKAASAAAKPIEQPERLGSHIKQ